MTNEKTCDAEGCKQRKYLRHDYCDRHWVKREINERWDGWVAANDGFKPLPYLAVHPADWREMDFPLEFKGLPVRPLGLTLERAKEIREVIYAA